MRDHVVPTVHEVQGHASEYREIVTAFDPVTLTSEQRASPHFAVHSEQGRYIRISIPRDADQELREDDVLVVDQDVAVIVKAAPEDLIIVGATNAFEASIAAYQLGNLHQPARFQPNAMLTPYDPMAAQVLDRLKIPYSREMTPFVGERVGAYTGHSH